MSASWTDQIGHFFRLHLPQLTQAVASGIYHYRREAEGNVTRFHMRVEEDGSGLLLANSSIAARLSPSGVVIARAILEGKQQQEVRQIVKRVFRDVSQSQFDSDYRKLRAFIDTLANPEDNYPIFNLDDPAVTSSRGLFAPFHAQMPVADPEKINPLIQKLWENGIVHITFAAAPAASMTDAVHNIERAEDTGMISGLRASGTWLRASEVLKSAAMAGVDYVTAPVLSVEANAHDAYLKNGDFAAAFESFEYCKKLEVCPVAEIPLMQANLNALPALLQRLKEIGVTNVQYYAIAGEAKNALKPTEVIRAAAIVEELAHTAEVRYVWLPPIAVDGGDIRSIVRHGPRTAGDVSIRVETDGSVYPPRGPYQPAGNLLTDSWEAIWDNPSFLRYRKRVESATHCDICPGLEICAADCPGSRDGWATGDRK